MELSKHSRIKTMFGSSLPPGVCRRAHVSFTICVFVGRIVVSNIYCVVFLFVFLRIVYPMLTHCVVLCTLCCQFLWILNFVLPLRYSLTFIYDISLMLCFSVFLDCELMYCSHCLLQIYQGHPRYKSGHRLYIIICILWHQI